MAAVQRYKPAGKLLPIGGSRKQRAAPESKEQPRKTGASSVGKCICSAVKLHKQVESMKENTINQDGRKLTKAEEKKKRTI